MRPSSDKAPSPIIVSPSQPSSLAIDFSSYFGDGGANNRSVAIDPQGNIYMVGGTSSTSWPTTPGAFQTQHSGGGWPDVTAAKFDPQGNLLWSTFIGGPGEDYGYVSAVNDQGELFISGRAGPGFPTTNGAFDETFNGGIGSGSVHGPVDVFVVKLSADGSQLLYSTYIGGSHDDRSRGIHLLPSGEVLVSGDRTSSPDLPVTPGAYKQQLSGTYDSWVAKVAADGSQLGFLTYFGTDDDDAEGENIRGLGLDGSGNIWIGGVTNGSSGIATTADAFQPNHGGGTREAFIGKLSSDGKNLLYFSWLGGSGIDVIEAKGVADAQGNFYVTGVTTSSDFPVTPGAFQTTLKGTGSPRYDGWVGKINEDGSLGFATYYGGTGQTWNEVFFGPVVDGQGNVYVTGRFDSADLPVTADAFQPQKAGGAAAPSDAVLVGFDPTGSSLLYGSYYGGTGIEIGRHLGIHPDGSSLVIIGETNSTDLPLVTPYQQAPAGAYLAKFSFIAGPSTRYVATTGSDASNDCTNPATPCATVGHAASQANAGDTLDLAAGTYNEPGLVIDTTLIIQGQGVVMQ